MTGLISLPFLVRESHMASWKHSFGVDIQNCVGLLSNFGLLLIGSEIR